MTPPVHIRLERRTEYELNTGCWLFSGSLSADGYGLIWDAPRVCRAHRVSWEIHRGPIPEGLNVLHRCDTPPCFNPDHLFLGTQVNNMLDAATKGRLEGRNVARGSGAGSARLTEDQVAEILLLLSYTYDPQHVIAERYGISQMTVSLIHQRKTWRHVHALASGDPA